MVKPATETEPKYKGVRKRKWGRWVSEIRLPNSRERIWLGSYDSPEKAAKAFDAALFCLRGNTARFNFPDQPPNIPGGRSLSPPEIQATAARFANSWSESSPSGSCSGTGTAVAIDAASSSFSSQLLLQDHNSNVPDYGIFPGFDDYFMGSPAMISPGSPQNSCDEDILQGPSILWNFN